MNDFTIFSIVATLASAIIVGTYGNPSHRDGDLTISHLFTELAPEVPMTNFNFMVAGRNLILQGNLDVNPQLSIFYKSFQYDLNSQSSEVIRHSTNPNWMTVFKSSFDTLDPDQEYHFKVKDVQGGQSTPIGETKLAIQKIWNVVEAEGEATLPLSNGNGHLVITRTVNLIFKVSAMNLAKRDTFGGLSDPYLKCLWSRGPDGPEVEFYRTAWIGNTVHVDWPEVIQFTGYQKGTDQYLHFKVYDDDGITEDDFLGEAFLKLDDHFKMEYNEKRVIVLKNEPKKTGRTGTVIITFQTPPPSKLATSGNPGNPLSSNDWFYSI